ncbi:hypothetical protein [Mucilaginibacter sp.]|uniref:hypothetical protein n=1 Tax=Mucilaginibacter sp. TaxID=1882438 RepID=UPI002846960C|nr:hypothetical protein [Mucilaginibacter sp.]MDR3695639.1 hypothetical protein [Mucilaginibacter sp.]
MSDEKNPKEASNIFHSIMKASVTPPKKICLYCDLPMKLIQPPNLALVCSAKAKEVAY